MHIYEGDPTLNPDGTVRKATWGDEEKYWKNEYDARGDESMSICGDDDEDEDEDADEAEEYA